MIVTDKRGERFSVFRSMDQQKRTVLVMGKLSPVEPVVQLAIASGSNPDLWHIGCNDLLGTYQKELQMQYPETHTKFKHGDTACKIKGSQWHGTVVGWYSTDLTPEGYAVESATERGSVQIYPAAALDPWVPNMYSAAITQDDVLRYYELTKA